MDLDFVDDTLIITRDAKKRDLLKRIGKEKKLSNAKIIGLEEFKKKYCFDYTKEAIFYIHKKYDVNMEIAKIFADNLYYLEDTNIKTPKTDILLEIKKYLEENNLLKIDTIFKKYIHRSNIVLLEVDYEDNFYERIFKKIENYTKIERIPFHKKNRINKIPLYKFSKLEDEISFVASEIVKLIKNDVPVEKIKVINIEEPYKFALSNIFKDFNIPIYIPTDETIASTILLAEFKRLYSSDMTRAIEELKKLIKTPRDRSIFETIINGINEYSWVKNYEEVKDIIIDDLSKKTIPNDTYSGVVEIVDLESYTPADGDYVFLLNFNQGIIPKTKKDEDYLDDQIKVELGISDSIDYNKKNLEKTKLALANIENLTVTYCDRDLSGELYISNAYDEEMFEIKKSNMTFEHSESYNKKCLLTARDERRKYGSESENYHILNNHYKDEPYQSYDNTFKGINKESLKNYLENKLTLSYSSMNSYYKCGFRYYLEYVLKIDKFHDTFDTALGNIFHSVLSEAFKEDFNFENSWQKALEEKQITFNEMETFFLDILKKELEFIIDTIKEEKEYSSLKEELYEQKIEVPIDDKNNVTFKGFIDKIMYGNFEDGKIAAIVDYKTGNPELNIDNAIYGLDMQLPVYAYLIKKFEPLKDAHIGGFYLQKILHNEIDVEKKRNALKLQGYSNGKIKILEKVDSTYEDSRLIKSLKIGKEGFSKYSKILSDSEIDTMIDLVDRKILEASKDILEAKFDINPKEIGGKMKGCAFCRFKDICFVKNKDILKLKSVKREEFLGGETYADVD